MCVCVYGLLSSLFPLPSSLSGLVMLNFPFVGDSLNSSLVAIVSVDPDSLKAWANSQGIAVV